MISVMARNRSEAQKPTQAEAQQATDQLVTSAQPSVTNGEMPDLPEKYLKITEQIYDIDDPAALMGELIAALKIDEALTPGNLTAALNIAEDNARRAHQLYVCVKADHDHYEVECSVVTDALRSAALEELQDEKDKGQRKKAITEADISARIAVMYPDEFRDLRARKIRAEGTMEHVKRVAELHRKRCESITGMLYAGRR